MKKFSAKEPTKLLQSTVGTMKAKRAQQNNFDDKIKDIKSKIDFFERWVGREQRIDKLKEFQIRKKIFV